MKKILLMGLIFALLLSATGCGCSHQWAEADCTTPKTCTKCGTTEGAALDHAPGTLRITAVNTDTLTLTQELPCDRCGAVIETKEASTGIAPVTDVMPLSPEEWFHCLATNIRQMGANQTLVPYGAESEDNAYIQGVVSFSGLKAAYTFQDAEGNTLTTEQGNLRDLATSICLDVQFTNEIASEFYMLLMLTLINNNSSLDLNAANELAERIMTFECVGDNGYSYLLNIRSKEDHTVRLTISVN